MLARLPRVGGLGFVRTLLTPAAELGRSRFGGVRPRLLLAGNAGHADIPLDAPGSGLMALLMTMLGQTVGFPVPEGGAGELSRALARRLTDRGGEIRCGAEVTRVEVRAGRAAGVRTRDGERHGARRAVVADVVAPKLFWQLLDPDDVPGRISRGMQAFQLDPATVKVDWALSGPVPWASPPAHDPGTVHVADSVEQMAEATGQVAAGAVPADPFLLMGQMTTTDPTRSPAGTESAWAYTHVPQEVVRDAGDGTIRGVWDSGTASASPTGCRPGSNGWPRASGTASPPAASSGRASSRPATPTWSAARSAAVRRSCTSSWSSGRSPGWAARRPASPGSTWARRPRTRAAACTARRARTPPGPPCCTTGCVRCPLRRGAR